MPPEDVGAPVAEPVPAPIIPTPTEPIEAVPTPEREPGVEEPTPESGAPETADEAPTLEQVRQQTLDTIEELRKSDPELAAQMAARFSEKPADVGEERLTWERERAQTERIQRWDQVTAAYALYAPETAQQQVVGILTDLNQRIMAAAKDLHEGRVEDPEQVQFDPHGWANLLTPLIAGGQGALRDVVVAATQSVVLDTLEAHPAHRYLNTEERTAFQAAVATGRYNDAIRLHLDAAIRAAPEEVAKQAKDKADKDSGLLDKFLKAQEAFGRNGAKSLTGAGQGGTGQPRDETEARNWHATGKYTNQQMREYLARNGAN